MMVMINYETVISVKLSNHKNHCTINNELNKKDVTFTIIRLAY